MCVPTIEAPDLYITGEWGAAKPANHKHSRIKDSHRVLMPFKNVFKFREMGNRGNAVLNLDISRVHVSAK